MRSKTLAENGVAGDAAEVAHALAARHRDSISADPDQSVLNYAERPRVGDWSMRSALTRYAQPQAMRSAQILTLVRRLDAVLRSAERELLRGTVLSDRSLDAASVAAPPADPYPDTRLADLARVARSLPGEFGGVLAAYVEAGSPPLTEIEQTALPLVGVALELDDLAALLAEWAHAGPANPPTDEVDEACDRVLTRLDELNVPVEEGWGRRRR